MSGFAVQPTTMGALEKTYERSVAKPRKTGRSEMRDYRGVDRKTGMTDRGPDGDQPPQKLPAQKLAAMREKKRGRGKKHSNARARDNAGRAAFRAAHGR